MKIQGKVIKGNTDFFAQALLNIKNEGENLEDQVFELVFNKKNRLKLLPEEKEKSVIQHLVIIFLNKYQKIKSNLKVDNDFLNQVTFPSEIPAFVSYGFLSTDKEKEFVESILPRFSQYGEIVVFDKLRRAIAEFILSDKESHHFLKIFEKMLKKEPLEKNQLLVIDRFSESLKKFHEENKDYIESTSKSEIVGKLRKQGEKGAFYIDSLTKKPIFIYQDQFESVKKNREVNRPSETYCYTLESQEILQVTNHKEFMVFLKTALNSLKNDGETRALSDAYISLFLKMKVEESKNSLKFTHKRTKGVIDMKSPWYNVGKTLATSLYVKFKNSNNLDSITAANKFRLVNVLEKETPTKRAGVVWKEFAKLEVSSVFLDEVSEKLLEMNDADLTEFLIGLYVIKSKEKTGETTKTETIEE